jgi:hypothetical protein
MQSTAVQLEMLRTKLELAVSSTLFPALVKLIPAIETLIPNVASAAGVFAAFVQAIAQNPISGIGALITASVVRDLASAGLGEAAKLAVSSGLSAMAAGGGILLALGA